MKRSLLFDDGRTSALVLAGMGLVACTYGLVRLAYGLYLPDVQSSLAMSSATAGIVSSGASVAYCVGAVFGLRAGDQSRRLVLGAIVTAAAGSAGMAAAPELWIFIPAAILGSTGAGLASPGLVTIVERNVSDSGRDRGQAVVNAGTGPGIVAAGLLALTLSPQWRVGFAISAVLSAATGIAVLLLDRPRSPEKSPADPPARPRQGRPRSWRWVLVLAIPATAAALLGASTAVVWIYGRAQLVSEGATATASLLAWIALGAGGTATVLTSRLLSGLHPAQAWSLTTASVAGATATLGLVADQGATAVVGCAVFGWGFVAATSALISWAGRLVPDRTAAGTSVLFITLVLGQAAGSAAAGFIVEGHGLSPAFLVAAAVAVLAAGCGLQPTRRLMCVW